MAQMFVFIYKNDFFFFCEIFKKVINHTEYKFLLSLFMLSYKKWNYFGEIFKEMIKHMEYKFLLHLCLFLYKKWN